MTMWLCGGLAASTELSMLVGLDTYSCCNVMGAFSLSDFYGTPVSDAISEACYSTSPWLKIFFKFFPLIVPFSQLMIFG